MKLNPRFTVSQRFFQIIRAVPAYMVLFPFAPVSAFASDADLGMRVWEGVVPNLEEVRTLEDQHKNLPRWAVFRTDRGDNQKRIEALLDEVADILAISEVQGLRSSLAALRAQNAADEAMIDDLQERRIFAPEEAFMGDTVTRIDAQTTKLRGAISDREKEIRETKVQFAEEVTQSGVDLSREQLDFLLTTVVGDTVIDIAIAFHNVRNITAQLEALATQSLESMETARRYYGMYTVLLKALDAIYDSAIAEIAQIYIPEINEIDTRARALISKTESLLDGTGALCGETFPPRSSPWRRRPCIAITWCSSEKGLWTPRKNYRRICRSRKTPMRR